MVARVDVFLAEREEARRDGDVNRYRSLTADLARLGFIETGERAPVERAVAGRLETPETPAAPPKRPGRKPLPRCEHGKIVGRCRDCEED